MKVAFRQQRAHVFEKPETVRALPTWVRIREMRANIAEACCAQKRITNRVRECISVGVSDRSLIEGDLNATEHKFAPGSEAVQVVADSGSGQRPTSAAIRSRLR
jgi:hypothetical protein